uniref:Uncharacterized protein n=1 Tax=Rhizophora mucronata TaxID=61149 RepID=A0A2P2JVT3_RHIMU
MGKKGGGWFSSMKKVFKSSSKEFSDKKVISQFSFFVFFNKLVGLSYALKARKF